jgi:protein CWC15
MTTAHRPTWKAAVGRADRGEGGVGFGGRGISTKTSALDAPAHTKLKFRPGHESQQHRQSEEEKEALKRKLLELEEIESTKAGISKLVRYGARPAVDEALEERAKQRLLKQTAEVDERALREKYDDSDAGGGADGSDDSDLDASDEDDTDLDGNDDSDDDDSEDDEEALQAELAKIRAEREASKRKEEEAVSAREQALEEESALVGNPLLLDPESSSGARGKRRWNEDVVFRNQARNEPAPKKRFINDTVRNDFHRRFLNKFIR